MLAHQDALLNLCLLNISFFAHDIDAFAGLLADHLVVLHLLHLLRHLLVVALLELHDFAGALARLLNLLPRLELLLLEQGDTIGEELGITFHTRNNSSRYSQSQSEKQKEKYRHVGRKNQQLQ